HVDKGTWENVSLDDLNVAAVVRARATLGDAFSNPLPAKAVLIVDQRANAAQRAALVHFAQAQAGQLLSNVVATETQPIRFTVDASKHGTASLEAGDLAQITTRAITDTDEICHNEEVYYEPLVSHLTHAMPAVASQSSYSGNHLSSTWNESNRRSAFIATFAVCIFMWSKMGRVQSGLSTEACLRWKNSPEWSANLCVSPKVVARAKYLLA